MAVTYVQLVNELLRRLNEVALDTAGDGFSSVRGVQALAKDSINNSIREIIQYNQTWPFAKTLYTQTMTAGTNQYSFPADFNIVDWDSFYLKKLSSANNLPSKLPVITYEDYLRQHRDAEEIGGTGSNATPMFIYQTHDSSFGVTPIPDDAYEIEFMYHAFPQDLTLFNDTTIDRSPKVNCVVLSLDRNVEHRTRGQ